MTFYLFDADGVIVYPREKLFSLRLQEDYGVPPEKVIPLFKNEFYKCVNGEMELMDVLPKYMQDWGWKGTIDDLLDYWWEGEGAPNMKVVALVDELRVSGKKVYMATDQTKERADYLMNVQKLGDHLDGAFFSYEIGASKEAPQYWQYVREKLGVTRDDTIYFWDDEKENVAAATAAGINAFLFNSADEVRQQMK